MFLGHCGIFSKSNFSVAFFFFFFSLLHIFFSLFYVIITIIVQSFLLSFYNFSYLAYAC